MSVRAGAWGVCGIALWVVSQMIAGVPAVLASACPNAQFRSGPSERLPDCRAYEQVSPQEKDGLDAITLEPMQLAQSSACEPGESCTMSYMNLGGSFAGASGADFANAYIGTRGTGGWQTTPLSPPMPQAPPAGVTSVTYAFSGDLSAVVLRVPLQQLTEDASPDVYNLYLRAPGGAYSLVTASDPSEPPASGCGGCFEAEDVPVFAGASSDFTHILFEANDSLEGAPSGEIEEAPGEAPRHIENLYEEAAGRVRPVDVLPDGSVAARGERAGGGITAIEKRTGELDHAISADGSRILFTAEADGGAPDPQQHGKAELYDRIDGSTIEISAPAPGARPGECQTQAGSCDPGAAKFWAASADGSAVYFTSKAALTSDSFTGPEESPTTEDLGNDLYRYDVDTGALADLTVDGHDAEDQDGAGVLGVVGAAEDGSYVYFVAEGHLAEGAPAGLAPHLYVWHETEAGEGTVRYIATLAAPQGHEQENIAHGRVGTGFHYHSDILDWSSDPLASQAYVTPDGGHLAFMSVEPLTGYDNASANPAVEEGDPVHEVFEFEPTTGRIVCASCDPGGVEPLGSAFIGASLTARASTPFHQPRTLSDDGSRLFFTSPDPLVAGLVGGAEKVFEYENGGVQLISGAEGAANATFLDASASGNDVFFATRERLAPSDTDELLDVYDARVDGGFPAPAGVASCATGGCRSWSDPPLPPTPLSASSAGLGDQPASAPRLNRKQLLARALAKCRKLKSRRRAACRRTADRRYAPRAGSATRRAAPERHAAGR
jgi:hypothetical protein